MSELKIDTKTLEIMKNFQSINPSLLLKPGKELSTISPSKKILAIAKIEHPIESKFAILELTKFFGALSLFKEPIIKIDKKFLVISGDNRSLNYTFAEDNEVVSPPITPVTMPKTDVSFMLYEKDLQQLLKAASVLGMPEVVVVGDGEKVYIETTNTKQPSSDVYRVDVGDFEGGTKPFRAVFSVVNLKLLPKDYEVSLCVGSMARFKNDAIVYYIAVDSEKKKSTAKK